MVAGMKGERSVGWPSSTTTAKLSPPSISLWFPALTFRTLYCFFVIEHGRRRILHFNVTERPTSEWIVQQLREALPLPGPYRTVLFDRDDQVRRRCFRVSAGQRRATQFSPVLGARQVCIVLPNNAFLP
jgi:hypothetical protein